MFAYNKTSKNYMKKVLSQTFALKKNLKVY
jgi:hypothetical protein